MDEGAVQYFTFNGVDTVSLEATGLTNFINYVCLNATEVDIDFKLTQDMNN